MCSTYSLKSNKALAEEQQTSVKAVEEGRIAKGIYLPSFGSRFKSNLVCALDDDDDNNDVCMHLLAVAALRKFDLLHHTNKLFTG